MPTEEEIILLKNAVARKYISYGNATAIFAQQKRYRQQGQNFSVIKYLQDNHILSPHQIAELSAIDNDSGAKGTGQGEAVTIAKPITDSEDVVKTPKNLQTQKRQKTAISNKTIRMRLGHASHPKPLLIESRTATPSADPEPTTASTPVNSQSTTTTLQLPKQLTENIGTTRNGAFSAPVEEGEMTLVWGEEEEVQQKLHSAQLISPSHGQIIDLVQENTIVGRAASCDLCLLDEYISREHLCFTRIPLGFLVKNVGKNKVIIEKKGHQQSAPVEEKTLGPGDATLLTQEAVIIVGTQILYYFNTHNIKMAHLESSARDRKYNFYKNLALQKEELLDAAAVQKALIPPCTLFDNINVGLWFKYFAIADLSGDFFLYQKKRDAVYFCLGDVSGHGAAAALLASRISGMFEMLAERAESPKVIVHTISSHISKAKEEKHDLYALINVIKVAADNIELCIAGNSVPPLFYCAAEHKLISLNTPSTPAGLFKYKQFKSYSEVLEFQANDRLIMFTDGITEAQLLEGGMIGYSRAQEQITRQIEQGGASEDFLDSFLAWLTSISEIEDDLSMVLIGKR